MNTDYRTHIKRYSFGRWTLTRELLDVNARSSCDWCGSREGKFAYWCEHDSISGRESEFPGAFCSISCMRIYNNFDY